MYAQETTTYKAVLSPKAQAELQKNNFAPALAEFSAIIAREPKNDTAWGERALIYLRQKQYARALFDANQVVALSPQSVSAFNLRGDIKAAQMDLTGAIADFTKALAINSKSTSALNSRARAYEKQRDFKKAIADYGAIVENTSPNLKEARATALLARAKALQSFGNLELAKNDFSSVAQLSARRVGEANYGLGLILLQQKNYSAAEIAFQRALDRQYQLAKAKLREAHDLAKSDKLNQLFEATINDVADIAGILKKVEALQAAAQPFVDKLALTNAEDSRNQSLNRAALHPKLRAVKDYILATLPALERNKSEEARVAHAQLQSLLASVERLLSKTSDYQVANFRILASQSESMDKTNAIQDQLDEEDDFEKREALTDQYTAQVRVTRDIIIQGMAELARFNDPAWPTDKGNWQRALDFYNGLLE